MIVSERPFVLASFPPSSAHWGGHARVYLRLLAALYELLSCTPNQVGLGQTLNATRGLAPEVGPCSDKTCFARLCECSVTKSCGGQPSLRQP
jgi:hypothetical protein